MRFQTKIIVGYTIIVFTLALFLGLVFSRINTEMYREREKKDLEIAAKQTLAYVEEKVDQMEASINYILSNPQVRDGILLLGKSEQNHSNSYISQAKTNIRVGINTDYIIRRSYRIIIFNEKNDIFSTNTIHSSRITESVELDKMPYLEAAKEANGKSVLVNAHEDSWGVLSRPQVFSLVKEVQGDHAGYIEVQNLVNEFAELKTLERGIEYAIVINAGELLYSVSREFSIADYQDILTDPEAHLSEKKETNELIAKESSGRYAITVLTFKDLNELRRENIYNRLMPFFIALLVLIVSLFFVVIWSYFLTKPLSQLSMVMKNTKLENLGLSILIDTPNDEMKALLASYQELLKRLQKSIIKEKRLSVLQLQAQFDSLQAQVNPHFIYNVLNVISAKGTENEDESICEICGSLAAILRYSTSNKDRYATISEELEYLRHYFYLLKARYAHKISFSLEVEKEIYTRLIPKLTLQQIVENCINHGYKNKKGQMSITVRGWKQEGFWYMQIRDNGQGFERDILLQLQEKMKQVHKKILLEQENLKLEIGGMGIVNTYARCLLIYGDNMIFELKNTEEGAEVLLGASLNDVKGEEYVSGDYSG